MVAGPEIASSDAFAEAGELAETLGVPVWHQTVGYGAHFPSEHPCYVGALNRDQKRVRAILSEYDLMLCVGSDVLQMSVWSEVEPLPETTKVAMIGLRDWEMGKNFPAEIALARRREGDAEGAGAGAEEARRLGAGRQGRRPPSRSSPRRTGARSARSG